MSVILDNLAAGLSEAEILNKYPSLTHDAIKGSISYAAELARNGANEPDEPRTRGVFSPDYPRKVLFSQPVEVVMADVRPQGIKVVIDPRTARRLQDAE